MTFDVVKEFEEKIAHFYGASYAIATDCCTHALELSLRYADAKKITIPKRTYISVPFLAIKLGIEFEWEDTNWKGSYYLGNTNIIDAAVLWEEGSYVPGTLMCLSFQFQKHLNIGRGGMILTDDAAAAETLKKMSYDGRVPEKPWREQDIDTVGYHYYMTPEMAQIGLDKLPAAISSTPRHWVLSDWPDISKMTVFQK